MYIKLGQTWFKNDFGIKISENFDNYQSFRWGWVMIANFWERDKSYNEY